MGRTFGAKVAAYVAVVAAVGLFGAEAEVGAEVELRFVAVAQALRFSVSGRPKHIWFFAGEPILAH